MKKSYILILSLLILILSGTSSCTNLKALPTGKTIDKRLVGTWTGSENDQQIKGTRKEWEMLRKEDGTFILNFKSITPEETNEFVEEGTWWIENNKFFEHHDDSGKTDSYNFAVLNKNEVKFEMINSEINFENPTYQFIDKRKSTSDKLAKDGLSIENAIKVKSVSEEYSFVRTNCTDCQIKGQSLIFENKKPYDIITVITANGKEIFYYFDISSFYGNY